MRKIPATMASQHPDHASQPYWHHQTYIKTHDEAHECFLSFSDIGADEHMWDWEGKLVDESILERLLSDHYDYFQHQVLGKDKFLTFRLPNPQVENEFRLGRALMSILSNSSLARQMGLPSTPLFEVVLPMTEKATQLIEIQQAYREIANLKHPLYRLEKGSLQHLEMIPLFEQISTLINSHKILAEYMDYHLKVFGFLPPYIRPFMARSDPALNSGLVPIVLAIKIALSNYQDLAAKRNVALYPIIGAGSLPFRGGIRPSDINTFLDEYKGFSTVLLQSAFRYDYPREEVTAAVRTLHHQLPQLTAEHISPSHRRQLIEIIARFEQTYTQTIEGIAELINQIAGTIPKRRERVQHIGLFGYSREVGDVKLPRAIGFTAALYSLGVPPELIGTGRGIAALNTAQKELLQRYYVQLRPDLIWAGHFLNKENLRLLAKQSPAWEPIVEDVAAIEAFLGQELGPEDCCHYHHQELTTDILHHLEHEECIAEHIDQAALLRQSMG